MLTAGTHQKELLFNSRERLTLLCKTIFEFSDQYACGLQAWAVFPNHYHLIVIPPADARILRKMISHLHTHTAATINREDGAPGRKVWFQYWDTHLTFPRSYFARLNYVHQNAVHHGIVREASNYPWCSTGWLERKAEPAFRKRVLATKWDQVKAPDDFVVTPESCVS